MRRRPIYYARTRGESQTTEKWGDVLVKSYTLNCRWVASLMLSSAPAFPLALPFLVPLVYRTLYDRLEAIMGKTCTQDVLLVEDDPADIYLIQRAIADCSPDIRTWLVSRGT